MAITCLHALNMSKMIQIRNVPDEIHKTLKIRAVRASMSLSDYLLAELEQVASCPTPDEMRERLERRSRVLGGESSAEALRAERDAH